MILSFVCLFVLILNQINLIETCGASGGGTCRSSSSCYSMARLDIGRGSCSSGSVCCYNNPVKCRDGVTGVCVLGSNCPSGRLQTKGCTFWGNTNVKCCIATPRPTPRPTPNPTPKPIDCTWNPWGPYSACTANCNGGTQVRTRTKNPRQNGGQSCSGSTSDTKTCNTHGCPVNCAQSSTYTQWTACSPACGAGTRSRQRVITQQPQNGGAACIPPVTESCTNGCCAVNCEFSNWTSFGPCDKTCGDGIMTRMRAITKQASCNGKCDATIDTQECNVANCPDMCGVGAWTSWSPCSSSCVGGMQIRSRKVTINGPNCPKLYEQKMCNVDIPCGEGNCKDVANCSGHGLCQDDGTCKCSLAWTKDDVLGCVEIPKPNPAGDCSAIQDCSAFGYCKSDNTCLCFDGYEQDSVVGCKKTFVECDEESCGKSGTCDPIEKKCKCQIGYVSFENTCRRELLTLLFPGKGTYIAETKGIVWKISDGSLADIKNGGEGDTEPKVKDKVIGTNENGIIEDNRSLIFNFEYRMQLVEITLANVFNVTKSDEATLTFGDEQTFRLTKSVSSVETATIDGFNRYVIKACDNCTFGVEKITMRIVDDEYKQAQRVVLHGDVDIQHDTPLTIEPGRKVNIDGSLLFGAGGSVETESVDLTDPTIPLVRVEGDVTFGDNSTFLLRLSYRPSTGDEITLLESDGSDLTPSSKFTRVLVQFERKEDQCVTATAEQRVEVKKLIATLSVDESQCSAVDTMTMEASSEEGGSLTWLWILLVLLLLIVAVVIGVFIYLQEKKKRELAQYEYRSAMDQPGAGFAIDDTYQAMDLGVQPNEPYQLTPNGVEVAQTYGDGAQVVQAQTYDASANVVNAEARTYGALNGPSTPPASTYGTMTSAAMGQGYEALQITGQPGYPSTNGVDYRGASYVSASHASSERTYTTGAYTSTEVLRPTDQHEQHYIHQPFYDGTATRKTAEAALKPLPVGSFLVRPGRKANCLTLSAKQLDGKIGHGVLHMLADSQWRRDDDTQQFPDLISLLQSCDHLINVPSN